MNNANVKVSFYFNKSEADAEGNCPAIAWLNVRVTYGVALSETLPIHRLRTQTHATRKPDSRHYRRTGGFFAQSWPIGSIQVFRQYRKDALLLIVLTYNVGHNRLLGYAMANVRRVTLSRKSSPATGIFMRSKSRIVAIKASLSPASNAAEKESFNCCISRSRYLKSLPLSN